MHNFGAQGNTAIKFMDQEEMKLVKGKLKPPSKPYQMHGHKALLKGMVIKNQLCPFFSPVYTVYHRNRK